AAAHAPAAHAVAHHAATAHATHAAATKATATEAAAETTHAATGHAATGHAAAGHSTAALPPTAAPAAAPALAAAALAPPAGHADGRDCPLHLGTDKHRSPVDPLDRAGTAHAGAPVDLVAVVLVVRGPVAIVARGVVSLQRIRILVPEVPEAFFFRCPRR